MSELTLHCEGVCKTFEEGDLTVPVLSDIDLEVAPRERLAIVGASGSGKSTLLHILGGLARPDRGTVNVVGQDINRLGHRARGNLRNRALGFVYQFHHLLAEFTAVENVAMPLLIRRESTERALAEATRVLERVGLGSRTRHKPAELSGGERQRAAVARAMVTRPACILADEPTGNLDARTADSVHELLLELNVENHTSLVVVTHDMALAQKMDRIVGIENGTIVPR